MEGGGCWAYRPLTYVVDGIPGGSTHVIDEILCVKDMHLPSHWTLKAQVPGVSTTFPHSVQRGNVAYSSDFLPLVALAVHDVDRQHSLDDAYCLRRDGPLRTQDSHGHEPVHTIQIP